MSGRYGLPRDPKVEFFPDDANASARLDRLFHHVARLEIGEIAKKVRRRFDGDRHYANPGFARNVHVEVTNNCNLRCVMCPREEMTRPVGLMAMDLFRKTVDECAEHRKTVGGLALMGLGEPLLHPKLVEMSEYAKAGGIKHVYLSTNCLSLSRDKAKELLGSGALDEMIFSLDGARKETYESIRVGGNFERVSENIMTFFALKRDMGKRRPAVKLQLLVMNETRNEIAAFVEKWRPLLGDSDRIFIKDVDTFGGQVGDHRVDTSMLPPVRYPCRQLWRDFTVSWDGNVTVCCKDVLYKLAVGNLDGATMEALWKGDRWEKIRQIHLRHEWGKLSPCDVCNEWI